MGDNRPLIPFGPGAVVFVLVAAITAAGVVVFQGRSTSTEFTQGPTATGSASEPSQPTEPLPTTPSPSLSPLEPFPTGTIDITLPSASASPGDETPSAAEGSPTEPADLDVQVLVGTDDIEQVTDAVETLEGLGYTVVDQEPSTRSFEQTTVFYSEGHQSDAEALRATDPRFSEVAPAIEGLDAAIPLHVVIGVDWTGAG